jgi:hypothetical protein
MGLDQYALYENAEEAGEEATTFHTWRKHPDLHGWMFDLYRRKGGSGSFNAEDLVQLTMEDLDALRQVIEDGDFATTTGFFFGKSYRRGEEGFEEQQQDDLTFVDKAVELVKQGKNVFYTSWW